MNAQTHDVSTDARPAMGCFAVTCDMGGSNRRERERQTLSTVLRVSEDGWHALLPHAGQSTKWSEPATSIDAAIERAARASNPQWKITRGLNFLVVLAAGQACGVSAYDEARRVPQGWQWRTAGSREWGATSATLDGGLTSAPSLAMAA